MQRKSRAISVDACIARRLHFSCCRENQLRSSSEGVCYLTTRVMRYILLYLVPRIDISASPRAGRNFSVHSAVNLHLSTDVTPSLLAVSKACASVVCAKAGEPAPISAKKAGANHRALNLHESLKYRFVVRKRDKTDLQSARCELEPITERKICTNYRAQSSPVSAR